jgi:prevent-host-death family protein
MDTIDISVGDAKSRFSEMISRAASGERFVIRRRNRPIAALISTNDLERLEGRQQMGADLARRFGQKASIVQAIETGQVHPLVAFYGIWAKQSEWDTIVSDAYKNRSSKRKRPVVDL